MSPCNSCGKDDVEKVIGKKYCIVCNYNKYKECNTCHKLYPTSDFFSQNNPKRCNSCYDKLMLKIEKSKNVFL